MPRNLPTTCLSHFIHFFLEKERGSFSSDIFELCLDASLPNEGACPANSVACDRTCVETTAATTTTTMSTSIHIFKTYAWYFENQERLLAELSARCTVRPEQVFPIIRHLLNVGAFPARDAFLYLHEFEAAVRVAVLAGSIELKQEAEALLAQEAAEELAEDLADEKAHQLKRRAELKERNAKRALQATPACEDAMPTRRSSKRACCAAADLKV